LAKLDNVKVTAATIEYNGAAYVQNDEKAAVGDILRIGSESRSWVTDGGFYEVTRVDGAGDPHFEDNDGDDYDASNLDENPSVFKRAVARLGVGDYAKVVSLTAHNYALGAVIKIVVDDESGVPYRGEKANGSVGNWLTEANVERATEAEFVAQKKPSVAAVAKDDVIIHEGRQYRKVARKANVGELVVVIGTGTHVFDLGKVARITEVNEANRNQTRRADNRTCGWLYEREYRVLEPLEAAKAPALPAKLPEEYVIHDGKVYRKEARTAKVGELITVVDWRPTYHVHTNPAKVGDVYEVKRIDSAGDVLISDDHYVFKREYNVLVPAESVTLNGAEFTFESRKARVGETVLVVMAAATYERYGNGDIVKVIELDRTQDAILNGRWAIPQEYVVLAPKQTSKKITVGDAVRINVPESQRTHNGRAGVSNSEIGTVTSVNGDKVIVTWPSYGAGWNGIASELDIVEAPLQAPQPERFKIGEYAKVIGKDRPFVSDGITEGTVVSVIETDESLRPYRVRSVTEDRATGWFTSEQLVRATDSEVAEAKAQLERGKFATGDKVRLVSGGGVSPLSGYHNGQIYEVKDPQSTAWGGSIRLGGGDVSTAYAKPDQLEKVSAEDVAEITKWAAIGRKVGEYKAGDVVEITGNSNGSVNRIGAIGTVGDGPRGEESYRVDTGAGEYGNWTKTFDMKLVTPVEQRFDRTKSA